MCGIFGYVGYKIAYPYLMQGLRRLEYRGYDGAGIGILNSRLHIYRKKGRVSELGTLLDLLSPAGNTGIGHTRWATHGEPSEVNSHPHCSHDGRLAIVHNGVVENCSDIRKELSIKKHTFKSETDTEVLVNLIEEVQREVNCSLEEAIRAALQRVVGAFVILMLDERRPGTIYAARRGSPLLIGIGHGEHYLASDASAFVKYTDRMVAVADDELAIVTAESISLKSFNNVMRTPCIETLNLDLPAIETMDYPHYMLKEIYEQSKTTRDCLNGRLDLQTGSLNLNGLFERSCHFKAVERVIFLGCGSSRHAAMVAEYFFEDLSHIPVEVDYASEFRYRTPVLRPSDMIIAVSQSGETADTLVAIKEAKSAGVLVLSICNVVGSSIARCADAGIYTQAGPEIAVASTKAFTAQLVVLLLLGLSMGRERGHLADQRYFWLIQELNSLPDKVDEVLRQNAAVSKIAQELQHARCFMYLGRGCNYPIALEGALKLMEVSYIPAEGYPTAEMKHGPIALVDESSPVVCIATRDKCYEKTLSTIHELKARKAVIVAIVSQGDTEVVKLVDYALAVPETDPILSPILSVVILQLFAYHMAAIQGLDVDKPRNLAKSVTVE